MAVVGDAYIVVRALTDRVRDDIRDGFKGADREGERAGKDTSDGFDRGWRRGGGSRDGMFKNLIRNADAAREKFNRLIQAGYILGPALVAVGSAIGGLGAGLFALGAQAATAGPALLSLINVFSAVAQAGFTLMAVFKGVGSAIGAGLSDSGGGGGGGAANLAKQIEDANRRIEDAQKRLAQVIQQNGERIIQANKDIELAERAKRDAMYESEQADIAVTDAEEDLQDAYAATSEARKQAEEDIQQLNFALEDAVLSEERAVLKLEDARDALAKVANLPPNNRQRREAELAFKEAELRLRQAKDRTSDTQEEVNEANEKGVEGSDRVVAALEREKNAARGVDAAKRAQYLATRDLADAEENLQDAVNNLNAVIEENKARLAEAEQEVKNAKRALDDVKNSAGGAGGGVDKFGEAMAKLSPKAQEFVNIILGIVEAFKPIKLLAQEEFFGNFNDSVQELADVYLPVLEEKLPVTAGLLGDIGSNILDVVSSTENVARVERIWDSNDIVISNLGSAVTNLVDTLIILLDNLRPLAEEFSEWIDDVTFGWRETAKAKDATGELANTFAESAGSVKQLGGIFGGLFRTIRNLGKAASGPGSGGQMLMDLLEELVDKWETFTGSVEGQNFLEDYFRDIVPIVQEVGGLIGDIFREIFSLAGETSEETADFFGSLREAVGILGDMGPEISSALPIIGEFIVNATEAIDSLTSSGAIDTFFSVLRDAAGVFASIAGSPAFQVIFGIVAPIFAASRGLQLVLKFLRFIFLGAIVGNIIKFNKAFKVVDKTLFLLRKRAALTRLAFIKYPKTMGLVKLAFGPVGLAIAGLVAAFIAMWNESEIFREAIKALIDNTLNVLKEVFDDIKAAVEEALIPFGGAEVLIDKLKSAFKFLGDIIGTYVIPILSKIIEFLLRLVGFVIVKIIQAIGFLWRAWKFAFDIIYAVVEAVVNWFRDTVWPIIQTVINLIIGYYRFLWSVVKFVWDAIYGAIEFVVNWFRDTVWPIIQSVINFIKGYFNILSIIVQKVWATILLAVEIFVNWFRDTVWPIIENVINWIKDGFETVRDKLDDAWNFIKYKVIRPVVMWLKNNIWPIIETVWNNIKSGIETVRDVLKRVWNRIKSNIDTVVSAIKEFLSPLWDGITSAFRKVKNALVGPGDGGNGGIWGSLKKAVSNVVDGIKGFFTGLWDGLTNGLTTAVNSVKRTLNTMIGFVNFVIDGANKLPGPDIPDIDPIPLARGGIISPRSGGTLALIAEAGRSERVEPLDENGLSNRDKAMISYLTGGQGGGTTINVYPSPGMDERELAQKVSRELALQVRRGAL